MIKFWVFFAPLTDSLTSNLPVFISGKGLMEVNQNVHQDLKV